MNVHFRLSGEKQTTVVSTPEAMFALIPTLSAEGLPKAFTLTREDGAELIAAANAERGFLGYFPPGYDGTRSFSSIDELDAKGMFPILVDGEFTEVNMENTVDRQRFESVLIDFMQHPGLPRGIAWQRD